MRIAVIGAGGIGAIYGALLAKAGAGVIFVARGAHLAAMQQSGLRIEGDRGETVIRPARATDDVGEHRRGSITRCSASSCGMSRAPADQLRPIIGAGSAVVPLQNGVDAHERLIPILGRAAVMGGTAFVTGSIVAPGVVPRPGSIAR